MFRFKSGVTLEFLHQQLVELRDELRDCWADVRACLDMLDARLECWEAHVDRSRDDLALVSSMIRRHKLAPLAPAE